jgi:hypothetical protein
MITHYELTPAVHYYPSPVDEPEHLDPGDIDRNGLCCHGVTDCEECGKVKGGEMTKYHCKGESPELHKLRCTAKYRKMLGKFEKGGITYGQYFDWLRKQLGM